MAPKKVKAEQLGLGEAPAAPAKVLSSPAPDPAPALVEYQHGSETWLCKRFDALVAELPGLTVALLPRLQAALELQDRQWLITRRLYGLMPQTPSAKYPLADMRVWTRGELVDALNIVKGEQWQQELNAIRGVWEAVKPKEVESGELKVESPVLRKGLFSDDDLVRKYDFGRVNFRDRDEAARFAGRLREVEKLFSEKTTAFLGRQLLIMEMNLSRIDEEISFANILGKDYRDNTNLRSKLAADYDTLLKTIDKLAPWFGAIAGKYSFKGAIAEITAAIQAYQADGNTALIDGIFTATEIQVECRRSVQAPEPRYRYGWVVNALEAKANLWNQAWKPTTPHSLLAKLDKGMREGLKLAGQESGEVLPDLEKAGEAGEYPPLEILKTETLKS